AARQDAAIRSQHPSRSVLGHAHPWTFLAHPRASNRRGARSM
ncbi:MAG: hypothetical protein AVDCRST_MAG86-1552, partial [uncultured Truepera sp.]